MSKEVLSIITENLMNERLDKIIIQMEEYKQAEKQGCQMKETFEKMLSQEQFKAYNQYLTAQNHFIAVYTKICYQQGMKDIASLLLSLVDK